MSDLVTLSCPSCGGKLQITSDIDRFACMHCGQEHVVKRSGGIVSISPIIDAIKKVGIGVDKTASELAIVRLQKDIDNLRMKKTNLLSRSPRPVTSPVSALLLVFCFILLGGLLCVIGPSAPSDDYLMIIIMGIFSIGMILIGGIPLFVLRPKGIKSWGETTGVQLELLDEQIAEKNLELQRHQKIVSQ
jgi:hypothetical protein